MLRVPGAQRVLHATLELQLYCGFNYQMSTKHSHSECLGKQTWDRISAAGLCPSCWDRKSDKPGWLLPRPSQKVRCAAAKRGHSRPAQLPAPQAFPALTTHPHPSIQPLPGLRMRSTETAAPLDGSSSHVCWGSVCVLLFFKGSYENVRQSCGWLTFPVQSHSHLVTGYISFGITWDLNPASPTS